MRKLLLIALTAALVIGATPALAQIAGSWEGTGTGVCLPPFPTPSKAMGPWRIWDGVIPDDEATFAGQWHDAWGFQGSFYGEATIATPTEVVFTGTWNVFSPDGSIYEMGIFDMHFTYDGRACHGEWWTNESDVPKGTMTGHRSD